MSARGPWLKLYESIMYEPKIRRISRERLGDLVMLWALASATQKEGRLPPLDDIAFVLRRSIDDVPQAVTSVTCDVTGDVTKHPQNPLPDRNMGTISVLNELVIAGLVEKVRGGPDGWCFAIHAWEEHQTKSSSSAERMRRHRARTSDVTSDESDGAEERRGEKKKERKKKVRSTPTPTSPAIAHPPAPPEASPDKPKLDPTKLTRDQWRSFLGGAREHRAGLGAQLGPMPGQPGCLVPADILWPSDGRDWCDWADLPRLKAEGRR